MIEIIRKIPRKLHVWRPYLSEGSHCEPNEFCNSCMEKFQSQVDGERPGHAWRVEDGKVIYMEDEIIETHLGRKLKSTESVLHKDGNTLNNRLTNLEVVSIERLDS